MKSLYIFFFFPILLLFPLIGGAHAQNPLVLKFGHSAKNKIDIAKEYKYRLLELILSKTESEEGPFRTEVAG